jgi:hypothetical protein
MVCKTIYSGSNPVVQFNKKYGTVTEWLGIPLQKDSQAFNSPLCLMTYTGEKKKQYQLEWVTRRRIEWFLEKWCVKCGSVDDLELDHIDPALKVTNSIWSWSKAKQETELAKCQVLCSICHKSKSASEKPVGEKNPTAKLTVADVLVIRELKLSQREIGRMFKINQRTVSRIKRRELWKHV